MRSIIRSDSLPTSSWSSVPPRGPRATRASACHVSGNGDSAKQPRPKPLLVSRAVQAGRGRSCQGSDWRGPNARLCDRFAQLAGLGPSGHESHTALTGATSQAPGAGAAAGGAAVHPQLLEVGVETDGPDVAKVQLPAPLDELPPAAHCVDASRKALPRCDLTRVIENAPDKPPRCPARCFPLEDAHAFRTLRQFVAATLARCRQSRVTFGVVVPISGSRRWGGRTLRDSVTRPVGRLN